MDKENFITEVDLMDEAKECFLTYSSEVLTDRAIPSVEDGLLSAQRKILWTMEDYLKMDSKSKTKKCNSLVGSTLSTSYFHGDASCYGVLCKMAQEFLMRYPLITGQGSLGTQESNDMVASSRYTEAKPSLFTDLMMNDFKKKVVPEKETYNGEFMEPVVLPSLFPNALCNGRQAIGISMAHNSAPHNLTEVCNAAIHYLQKNGEITLDELMNDIPGPDFPLGGTVINIKDVREAFATGKSSTSLKIRGDYEINGKDIIFTSIPYRAYRNKIKEQIADNIDELEKVITDFEDESSVGENRLVFTVKDEASLNPALNKLFALTDLQTTLSYNMNFIVDGTPKLCSLYTLIKCYVEHQEKVLLAATAYDKDKAEKRLHILNGLIAAIDKIDEVIALIRASENKTEARTGLMKLLGVDEVQADAILDMKLAKLTRIDKNELIEEKKEKEELIAIYNRIINEKDYRNGILIEKITKLKEQYGDARRTKLVNLETASKEEKEIEFVEPEKCVVIMTEGGLIKRIPSSSFKNQKRNGKGVRTQDDITNAIIRTNTIDSLMIFTDKGRMYRLLVNDIPVGTNVSQGQSVKSLVTMEPNEKPATIYSIYRDTDAKYVLFATKRGLVKKTSLDEYVKTKKKSGIAAINIKEDDELAAVTLVKDEDLILITSSGMAIKFNSNEIGATARATSGVKGIDLKKDDILVAALPIRNKTDNLAMFSKIGLGKKISLDELPLQKRAGKGLMCYKPTPTTGDIVAATLVEDSDSILISGDKNSICIEAKEIPLLTRAATGNIIIKNSNIISASKV
jgi:DNA gyrase subunit A